MDEQENKKEFNISQMNEEELLRAYDIIKDFLSYLKDNKLEIEEKGSTNNG